MKKSCFVIYALLGTAWFKSSLGQSKEAQSLVHYFQTSKFTQCDSALKAVRVNAVDYLKEDTNKVKILYRIVGCLSHIGPVDTTNRYAAELTALSDKLNFRRADTHWLVASLKSGTPEAVRDFLGVVKMAEEANDTLLLADSYGALGLEYQMARNYPAAVEAFYNRLKLDSDRYRQIPTLTNLSIVYQQQKKYDDALKIMNENILTVYKKLHEISVMNPKGEDDAKSRRVDSMEKLKQIAINKINAAGLYSDRLNFQEAIRIYNEVINDPDMVRLSRFNNVGYYPIMAVYYLSDLYLKKAKHEIKNITDKRTNVDRELDSAVQLAHKFIDKWRQYYYLDARDPNALGSRKLNYYLYPLWGRYFYTKALTLSGKRATALYDSSILYFEKDMADSFKKAEHTNCYYDLFKAYSAIHDYKNAAKNADLYNRDRDSTVTNETNNRIEQLRVQYEVETAIAKEKADKEKELLAEKAKHDKDLADEKIRQEQLLGDEKARHERALIEEKYKHQTAMAEQKLKEEQLLSQQKLKDAHELADETAKLQRTEADEKLRHEKALYEEQIRHQNVLAEQKRTQDKLLAQRQRRTNQVAMGSGLLLLTALFSFLFLRQRSEKKRAIEKAEALHKMSELELQSLRSQLNPHFMFNSLNAIQELILLEENDKSHEYLTRFAKLVRMLLDNADQPFVSLSKEMEFLGLYLSLENLRVPDLHYSLEIEPDISAEQVKIPNMILQPYIENAIWHGLSHKADDRTLYVKIFRKGDAIALQVRDNGVGRKRAAELKSQYRQHHNSKGMELLSKRFKLLAKEYGTNIQTSIVDVIEDNHPAGTLVEVIVPQSFSEPVKETAYVAYNNN